MNVSLTPELTKFVEETVASGRYNSASELVRDGLRRLEEEQQWRRYALDTIAEGRADEAAGRTFSSDEFLAEIKRRRRKSA